MATRVQTIEAELKDLAAANLGQYSQLARAMLLNARELAFQADAGGATAAVSTIADHTTELAGHAQLISAVQSDVSGLKNAATETLGSHAAKIDEVDARLAAVESRLATLEANANAGHQQILQAIGALAGSGVGQNKEPGPAPAPAA